MNPIDPTEVHAEKPAKPPRKKKRSARIIAMMPIKNPDTEETKGMYCYAVVATGISDKDVLGKCAELKVKAADIVVAAIHLTGDADIAVTPAVEVWKFKKAKA